jgi:hypothetical protein
VDVKLKSAAAVRPPRGDPIHSAVGQHHLQRAGLGQHRISHDLPGCEGGLLGRAPFKVSTADVEAGSRQAVPGTESRHR